MRIEKWKYTGSFFCKLTGKGRISHHQHEFFELVYVLDGEAAHYLNGESGTLHTGDILLLDRTDVHGYAPIPGKPFRIINLCFLGEFLSPSLTGASQRKEIIVHPVVGIRPEQLRRAAVEIVFHDDGSLRPAIEQIHIEYADHRPGRLAIIRAELLQLIITLLRSTAEEKQDSFSPPTRSVIAYMEKHYSGRCTLADAASALRYSPHYLSHRFRLDTGLSFTDYLHRLRIEQACRLLVGTDLSVGAVASAIGYTDLKHFHSLFRAETGTTPRRYRTQRQQS